MSEHENKAENDQSTETLKTLHTQACGLVDPDPWQSIQSLTEARIGLGRAGTSTPTKAQLKFSLDHALARDAVVMPCDMLTIQSDLKSANIESLRLSSRARDRREFLQRPDLGRRLDVQSAEQLKSRKGSYTTDVTIILADGLSATGVEQHGGELCKALYHRCNDARFITSPVCLVDQGRVAIADEIGELLNTRATFIVIGERPGLSAPDSLGIYFTYAPKLGLNDASRNCISNIRPGGLSINEACEKAMWILHESMRRQLSGVNLKDTADNEELLKSDDLPKNFLLAPAQKGTR